MSKNVEEKIETNVTQTSVKHIGGTVGAFFTSPTQALKKVACIFAVIVLAVLPTPAQQSAEVQKQLEQLKQQYEQTTRDLQERIAALEQQIKKESEDKKNA